VKNNVSKVSRWNVLSTAAAGSLAVCFALDCCAAAQSDWPAVGGDWSNTRYSTLSQINVDTVRHLGAAWTAKLNVAGTTSAIVVTSGRMFVTAGAGIYALDPASGHILWSYEPKAVPSRKGLAVGDGRIYVGLSNADLIALDEITGALLWSAKVGDEGWKGVKLGRPPSHPMAEPSLASGQYISAAPAYANGTVIVGLANGDTGVRGRIVALAAASGRRLWQFFTIPGPGDRGHETWPPDSDVWKTGGGGVWMNPAIDPALGMVYLGVGNPVPQWGGEVRAGDNLFTDSVVALDILTGKLAWHFQGVHHDIWDSDFGTPLVLFDTVLGGRKRRALAAMRTDGYLFRLDRETGKPLQPIIETQVPHDAQMHMSRTQPFPVAMEPIGPRCVEKKMAPAGFRRKCFFDKFGKEPNLLFPFSATRTAPMTFSPQTGYFYVTGGVGPGWMQRSDDPYYMGFFRPVGGLKEYGLITALDSQSGKIVWQERVARRLEFGSGVTSTAGSLVFHGAPDGQLQAYDARNGSLLWSFQTGAPIRGPVSTYEANGEQYVAVGAHELWAFKLGAKLPPRTPPSVPLPKTKFPGAIVRADTIEIGAPVFDVGATGVHELFDENAYSPIRTRVAQGATLTWVNRGKRTHTIQSEDGTWTTGPIPPGRSKSLSVSKPGQYAFNCKEHPWSTGELTVGDLSINLQADRGERLYEKNCAACHQRDLTGREPAPQLAGPEFMAKWLGHSIGDLYDIVRITMPPGKPNGLNEQEYLDIVDFLLSANDVASTGKELKLGSPELTGRKIQAAY
jgi:PQQ-dependent dehydrogenase (methanol/ethanol family)